ncbi:hypothetical protein HC891_10885 [Candidatus Gracilibacteria bacterium]|nr:hypothetical protein [Candidatus Gracilibacteria bacterium]
MSQQQAEGRVNRRCIDQMVVVEDEHNRLRERSECVNQVCHRCGRRWCLWRKQRSQQPRPKLRHDGL